MWKRILLTLVLCLGAIQGDSLCYWQPHLSGTFRAGSYRQGGSLDLFVPVWQDHGSIVFAQVHGARLKREWDAGAGAGIRTLLTPCLGVGINAFGEWSQSRYRINRGQFGLGGELLGGCWQARINGYLPNRRSTYVLFGPYFEETLSGVNILQNELAQIGINAAYAGFDAEVGVAPIITAWSELWGYGGYFRFTSKGAQVMQGPRARIEFRLEDLWGWCQARFTVGGEWQWDRVRKHQAAFTATLRLPIGWRSKTCCCPCRSICRRMGDPVYRDPGVTIHTRVVGTALLQSHVLGRLFFIWQSALAGAGTQADPTSLPDALSRAGPRDILIFMQDNGNIQISAAPGNTIPLQNFQQMLGYGNTGQIHLLFPGGGGTVITPLPGQSSARAQLDGVVGTDAIQMAAYNIISGLRVNGGNNQIVGTNIPNGLIDDMVLQGAGANAISITGPSSITISNSSIQGATSNGILLTGVVNARLLNNSPVQGGLSGASVVANGATQTTSQVLGNSFTGGTGAGFSYVQSGAGGYQLIFSSNTATSVTGAGVNLNNTTTNPALFSITDLADNTITGGATMTGGLLVSYATFPNTSGGNTTIGTIGNRVQQDGLNLNQVVGALRFNRLDIANNAGTGLFIRDAGGKAGTFFFSTGGGSINTTGGAAIDIDPVTLACTFGTVSSTASPQHAVNLNTVAGFLNMQGGLISGAATGAFRIVGPTDPVITYSGTVTNNSGTMIDINGQTGGAILFDGPSLTDTGAGGISVQNSASTVTVERATLSASTGDAITLSNNTGTFTFTDGLFQNLTTRALFGTNIDSLFLTDNQSTNCNSGVAALLTVNGFGSEVSITDNTFTNTTSTGGIASLVTVDTLTHTVEMNDNVLTNNVAIVTGGFAVSVSAPQATVNMNNNTATGNVLGTTLQASLGGDNSTGTFQMNDNTVNVVGTAGVAALQFTTLATSNDTALTGQINDNTVTTASGNGISCCQLASSGGGQAVLANVTSTGNTITSGGHGTVLELLDSKNPTDALTALVSSNRYINVPLSAVINILGRVNADQGVVSATIQSNTDTGGVLAQPAYYVGNTVNPNSTRVCATITGNTTTRVANGIRLEQSGAEVVNVSNLATLSALNNGMAVTTVGTIGNLGPSSCPLP